MTWEVIDRPRLITPQALENEEIAMSGFLRLWFAVWRQLIGVYGAPRCGGLGVAEEYDIEHMFRETRLYQVTPISTNVIFSHVATDVWDRRKVLSRTGLSGRPASPR
jgi:alkylation response protein AidB-like acyl-CoA dehydrogenase